MTVKKPGPACGSCPYRVDVPSGVWEEGEYRKLRDYDLRTPQQPPGVFLCHRQDGRVCGGWAGCHGTQVGEFDLLSVRVGLVLGTVSREVAQAIFEYETSVPLWPSGKDAAQHGLRDVEEPSEAARRVMDKVTRTRGDLRGGAGAEDPDPSGDAEELSR